MSLHFASFYAAKWTLDIENEWTSSLLRDRSDISPEQVQSTCAAMHRAVPDWQISNYQPLIAGLTLPDPNDRHVVAAAIRGHADCIVTTNLADFPNTYLETFDLEALHPDDFIVLQLDLNVINGIKALKKMRSRLRNPEMTPEQFAVHFEKLGLPRTACKLQEALDLL